MGPRGLFGVFLIIIFLIIAVPAELYHPNDSDFKKNELRGEVATDDFTWNPQNFAGFYYDLDNNIGTEQIATTFTEGNKLQEQQGIIYSTTAQKAAFEYEPWGYFNIIGFLGKPFFAGYILDENIPTDDQVLNLRSVDKCSLCDGQLQEILIDNSSKVVLTLDTPLTLAQGYKLNIKSIDYDADKIYIELTKDGKVVDSNAINTSKNWASIADRTYYFKKDVGNQKSLVIIAVHFKADYKDSDRSIVIVDGIWQISDISTEVKTDTLYDKMAISTVSADTIVMKNQDTMTLSQNKSINLIDDLTIKTADTDELKYYIYKNIQNPGQYEIRGTVASSDFIWNPQNFAGFYYDMNNNIGTEQITAIITEENKLQEPNGIIYSTTAQRTAFQFEGWGNYNVIGFMAEPYFAGYLLDKELPAEAQVLYAKSTDECSLCDEQLQKILMDNDDEMVVRKGDIIELGEGYDLIIKGISGERTWYLELRKDGQIIDSDVKSSSKTGTMLHSTYFYKKDVGDQKDLIIIAVHFRNNYNDLENTSAIIDGIWQISDNATKVGTGTEYGKMRISTVSADTIIMNNPNNTIILSKNKNIDLMEDIIIKTADAENLRYYVYKTVTIIPSK